MVLALLQNIFKQYQYMAVAGAEIKYDGGAGAENKNFGSATLISTILTSKCFKCLPEERGHMLIVKGQSATEESVEDHTAGPDVHRRGVAGAEQDLRTAVPQGNHLYRKRERGR